MDYNHTFFKFMHDLIDSGVWAELSSTARTLYPVLCRFSNETFKEVWPGTEELLKLTGFKTKKSLQLAKKELMDAGLIDVITGNGRTSSRYYFKFSYRRSRVDLESYRDTIVSLRGPQKQSPQVYDNANQGGISIPPNNINININTNNEKQMLFYENIENLLKKFLSQNNLNQSSGDIKNQIINKMLEKYGNLEVGEAIKIAIERGKNGDIRYLEGILKNRSNLINNNHNPKKETPANVTEIINKLSTKFKDLNDKLKFYYLYNNTYYFKSNNLNSTNEIEKYANEIGFKIKIIVSNQKEKNQSNIRFYQNNN
jgi:hypothetical protein